MEENNNPTPPVSDAPNPTPPVSEVVNPNPPVILSGTKDLKPSKKLPLKLITGIIVFLLLTTGAAASYVYKDQLVSLVAKPTPTPTPLPAEVSTKVGTPSPTPDPTVDWKTYVNKEAGYSLRLPPNVIFDQNKTITTSVLNSVYFYSNDYKEKVEEPGIGIPFVLSGSSLYVRTEQNANFKTDLDYIIFTEKNPSLPNNFKERKRTTEFGSLGLLTRGVYAFKSYETYYDTYANGKTFGFQFRSFENSDKLLLDILSTFKFTN